MAKTISASSLSVAGSYSQAWKIITQRKYGALNVAGVAAAGFFVYLFGSLSGNEFFSLVSSVVQVWTLWLAFWGFVQVARNNKSYSLVSKASDITGFIKYLATSLVALFITTIGFILLIIPGFYFLLKYAFAPLVVVDENVGIGQALKRSGEVASGHMFALLGFYLFSAVLLTVGALFAKVGFVVVYPFTLLAFVLLYSSWKK
jgi:uncharacterized membrane protein